MKDLSNRADIENLVTRFYEKIITDELIGKFFTEFIRLSFDHHLPIMFDFWETVLFKSDIYKGNPMLKHLELNRIYALKPVHFDRWLLLWEQTIRSNYEGELSEKAITQAHQIGQLMQFKLKGESPHFR